MGSITYSPLIIKKWEFAGQKGENGINYNWFCHERNLFKKAKLMIFIKRIKH